ncbi:hypothetical protein EYF80_039125 [Liparis tanakae]|uniref:Uncharacterized protein n=1 Tax=Liparis tanakae TaxID=230148 RepID=A0A4Z2GC37_9TELE|nr:hypothetical protein EYF80_039125 [Liparis tanakae]
MVIFSLATSHSSGTYTGATQRTTDYIQVTFLPAGLVLEKTKAPALQRPTTSLHAWMSMRYTVKGRRVGISRAAEPPEDIVSMIEGEQPLTAVTAAAAEPLGS